MVFSTTHARYYALARLVSFGMVSNKLMAVAFAALASIAVVDAGVCRPSGTTISSASATETSGTATATSTSVTIETVSTTTTSSAETGSTTAGTTSASSVETSSTVVETSSTLTAAVQTTSAESTSTTAQVTTPTNLITNPEFDQGLQPWQAIPYADQDLSLTPDSHKTEDAARLHFDSQSGSPFTNYLYHRIDKSLLRAGPYALEAFVKVDPPGGDEGEGCTRVVAACLVGPVGQTEAIDTVALLPARLAEGRWSKIQTTCDVTEEKLDEIDDFGVAIGFTCFETNAYLDTVSFKEVEIETD